MSNDDTAETIGYGKPPRSGRFQKGKSGNPKGRPKAAPKLADLFAQEAARLIPITEKGKTVKVPQLEVVVRRVFRDAMQGDRNAAKLVVQGMQGLPETPDGDHTISDHEVELLRKVLAQTETPA